MAPSAGYASFVNLPLVLLHESETLPIRLGDYTSMLDGYESVRVDWRIWGFCAGDARQCSKMQTAEKRPTEYARSIGTDSSLSRATGAKYMLQGDSPTCSQHLTRFACCSREMFCKLMREVDI